MGSEMCIRDRYCTYLGQMWHIMTYLVRIAVRPPTKTKISQTLRYNLSAFFVAPPLPAPSGVVASARLCCLSRVCASGRLSFAVGEHYYCVYFLSAISFHVHVHTPTPHSILRFRPAPQTPDLHTSNLPLRFNPRSRCNSSSRCWYRARDHVDPA